MNGPSPVKTARILIADDHELVRQGMRAILQSEPQWVVCGEATTGLQALTMTIELKPDLIILDVALPEMNGIEVTRQIRRAGPVAVLIVTMHDSDQVVQEAMEAGAEADLAAALAAAATAAAAGRDRITPLVARKGRASYLGERSAGHQDPGATSATILFEALRDQLGRAG